MPNKVLFYLYLAFVGFELFCLVRYLLHNKASVKAFWKKWVRDEEHFDPRWMGRYIE